MEDVLSLYAEQDDPWRPVVCFDERPCQLLDDVLTPIPLQPGQAQRYDYQYERCGTANIFGALNPKTGWRWLKVTEQRTRREFAECMRELVDVHYPEARCIRVVLDNLNTHSIASLYEAFPAQEARRIACKLDLHFTPKHGSWLNAVEMEFAVLSRQCLSRRIASVSRLRTEVEAWVARRNRGRIGVQWRFGVEDARRKLPHLYPTHAP